MDIVLVTVVQFVVSIVLAALAAYLGIWLFERSTKDIDEWQALRDGNAAVGLTLAAVVVGLAIILRPAVSADLPMTSGRLAPDVSTSLLPLLVLALMLTRALLGLVLGAAATLFAVWLFLRLTRDVDELAELAKGNLAVAVMLSGVILAIALLVSPVVTGITNSLFSLFFN